MIIKSVNRDTSLVLARINNQITKLYVSDGTVGLGKTSPFQILSSYSSEIVSIQKSPKLVAVVVGSSNP
jgi:hypothetical protein